jgi:hypothetical protein
VLGQGSGKTGLTLDLHRGPLGEQALLLPFVKRIVLPPAVSKTLSQTLSSVEGSKVEGSIIEGSLSKEEVGRDFQQGPLVRVENSVFRLSCLS